MFLSIYIIYGINGPCSIAMQIWRVPNSKWSHDLAHKILSGDIQYSLTLSKHIGLICVGTSNFYSIFQGLYQPFTNLPTIYPRFFAPGLGKRPRQAREAAWALWRPLSPATPGAVLKMHGWVDIYMFLALHQNVPRLSILYQYINWQWLIHIYIYREREKYLQSSLLTHLDNYRYNLLQLL